MVRMNWLKGKISVILASSLVIMTLSGCGSGGVGGLTTSTGTGGTTGGTTGGGSSTPVSTSASLSWDPSQTNSDGSPVTDLAGYKVYYGEAPGSYYASVDVGNTTSGVIEGLAAGTTYYFTVTAYDDSGNESSYAAEVSKTM